MRSREYRLAVGAAAQGGLKPLHQTARLTAGRRVKWSRSFWHVLRALSTRLRFIIGF
jgi:hypothetical protein